MAASNAEAYRFLSNVKRQSAPPRCHPFTIILLVLAVGMLFIGLTMTIIAHWPGASTIGENPLTIAGPVLLAVGGMLVLIGMIAVCCINRRERRKWQKLVHSHIDYRNQSRAAERSQVADRPSFEDQGQQRLGAVPPDSWENPDSSQGKPGNNSDAGYYKGGRYANVDNGDPNQFSSSFDGQGDDEDFIAEPKRPQKKRRAAPTGGAGGLSDTSADQSSGNNGTFGITTTTTTTKRTGEDGQTTEERTTKTSTKKTRQPADDNSDISFNDSRGGIGGKSSAAGRGGIQPPASPGESRMLRVHVKAQPGASVHIHPTGSPATQPRKAFSPSTTSGETDI